MAQSSTYQTISNRNRESWSALEAAIEGIVSVETIAIPVALSKKVEEALEIEERLIEKIRFIVREKTCNALRLD